MRVEVDRGALWKHLARRLYGLVHLGRHSRTRCVFEANRIKGDIRVQNFMQGLGIKFHIVRPLAPRRQFHDRDANLMFEPGFDNALAAVDEIVDIVERVEVANGGNAVFFEKVGVEFYDVPGLGLQADDVDTPSQGLQFGIRPHGLAEGVHHGKGIFIAIEIERLKTGSSSGLEVLDAGIPGCLQGRKEVRSENPGSVHGLETVAEGSAHEFNFFAHDASLALGMG